MSVNTGTNTKNKATNTVTEAAENDKALKEAKIFKLKKEAASNGYRYIPFTDDGKCESFFIEGIKTDDNTVLFTFMKNNGRRPYGGEICDAKVSSEKDWALAEMEMIDKFNANDGRLEGIFVVLNDL